MATANSKLADVPKPTAGTTAESVNMLCVLKSAGAIRQVPMVDMFYPVGSIYLTLNATNPSRLFGGTWEQIKGRFLLGAGDSYTVGSTGGEATHTLSVNEMPSHAHDTPFFNNMTDNGEMKSDFIGVFGKGVTASQALKDTGQSSTMEMWWVKQTNLADGPETAYLTSAKGDGAAHNNMPPYLSVYMWKRTA